MPKRSDYQPLAQSVDGDFEEEDVGLHHSRSTIPPAAPARRTSKRPQIDLRTIDTAFKRWTESIAQKVKRKKKTAVMEKQEIMHSVFGPEVVVPRGYTRTPKTLDHTAPMTQEGYLGMAESVRAAIADGHHPKMITKGSSGSYFVRAKVEGRLQIVGVFKPKDEEPYGRLNPKTTKWIHRQFRWVIPFGRACLIPNLSYISEAAASLLDERLQLYIVPRTELVTFSSPAFFYDWLDRSAAKKGKPLPGKVGSMQCFLNGFQDASEFLRVHPFPGRSISDTFDDSTHRTGGATKRFLSALQIICGRTGDEDLNDDDDDEERAYDGHQSGSVEGRPFYWSGILQQEFREELERLVILDFLMRNTDRGADNYMLKYCEGSHERSLIDIAPTRSNTSHMPVMRERVASGSNVPTMPPSSVFHSMAPGSSSASQDSGTASYTRSPHLHVNLSHLLDDSGLTIRSSRCIAVNFSWFKLAAIDNSLAWPHEHPKGWRSFTYGWLYLPVSVIGRPFSEKTRSHFLPLLTSKDWWEETTYQLRKLFALDPDFHPKMFRRQLAVMKGQAWNIIQCLKHSDEGKTYLYRYSLHEATFSELAGPLELTRRQKVLVWDDEVEISDEESVSEIADSLRSTITSGHLPQSTGGKAFTQKYSDRRVRSRSIGSYPFPPPMRRSRTDSAAGPGTRPVPFAAKYQRINPGASGVTVLEHMERLDEVERGLKKLGMEEAVVEEDEEEDMGVKTKAPVDVDKGGLLDRDLGDVATEQQVAASTSTSAPIISDHLSDDEADRRMSQSDAQIEAYGGSSHGRTTSDRGFRQSLDLAQGTEAPQGPSGTRKRTVIVEARMTHHVPLSS